MSVPDFRELYEQLLEYEGQRAYQDVLLPWQDKADQAMDVLKKYGEIQARLILDKDVIEHIWDLYALSRVSDLLLLPFQKGDYDGTSWPGPAITAQERDAYFISLGMTPIEQKTFHPFFHEIVEVTQSDDADEPITLEEVIWSGFMLGSMLFCRAGVRVRGGRNHIKKEIAEKSTLYFTFRRKNRPHQDASHGWGSNSQWRTKFRRDYEGDACYYYNAGGLGYQILEDTSTGRQNIEWLVNRCFILSDVPDEEESTYDYYDRFTERKAPERFTDQRKEDKIQERRRKRLKFPLHYYPLLVLTLVFFLIPVIIVIIVEKIRDSRKFRLLFVSFVIFVCLALVLLYC